jgi:dipeptide/tripeptide permease
MKDSKKSGFRSFPGQFWLVVMFEFFERGSYYGMMSFISVYFVNILNFPKESVGVIKGVIQPLLYFLPILSGALADRFGYRRLLMIAFSLLGGGYFLTSQASSYGAVFAALVIMGIGAGTFKPLISGTIAKITDESNSTLGFGIFYWSINLGAFLFPLILVPFLKAINPTYVIIASAICTAAMLIPTAFFYKDPVKIEKMEKRQQTSLIQTLANAFEIIYSPVVLIYYQMKKSVLRRTIIVVLLALILIFSIFKYSSQPQALESFARIGITHGNTTVVFENNRNMLGVEDYTIKVDPQTPGQIRLTIFKPALLSNFAPQLLQDLAPYPDLANLTLEDLRDWAQQSDQKIDLIFVKGSLSSPDFQVEQLDIQRFKVTLNNHAGYPGYEDDLLHNLHQYPILRGISSSDCNALYQATNSRSFFLLFIITVFFMALALVALTNRKIAEPGTVSKKNYLPLAIILVLGIGLWLLPGLSLLGRIISTVIFITLSSLLIIDKSSPIKFQDHAKFLLMIFLYSGFWVLYFQMFDSVLWYVQAYVDAGTLNAAINKFLRIFGVQINWFFDVEHVTVINAGTIILLQLLISRLVKSTKALPTMMAGIGIGTLGMAILAISANIWVFVLGITIFSIGEMTAHPKFISYIGFVAPPDRKAMYMGYLFLYGVFGSSIGGIVGARLYVHFVDVLNQPRTLWIIFSMIGVFTIISLFLYNKLIAERTVVQTEAQ